MVFFSRGAREVCRLTAVSFAMLAQASLAAATADSGTSPNTQTLSRDGDSTTLRANSLSDQVIKVDGRLDEEIYRRFEPASDFIQQEPKEGQPATERTEVWVFFDDKNVYVSARCLDSHPERMIANEMRRDHFNLFENENFAVVFDTFHDKRNGYMFYTTPLGGLFDGLITDETNINRDWNTVWDAKAARDDHGWTVEFAIPFKSLRYGAEALWGINFRRRVRWKNETSYLTSIPASFGRRGITKLSSAADMTGLESPTHSRAFEIKPYTTGSLKTDRALADRNDLSGEVGFDAKVTISSALALDLTYNTDFAQVEDDLQQVNLSRFSVFFPEKRDFFLEGQGIFSLGAQGGGGGGGGAAGSRDDLFYQPHFEWAADRYGIDADHVRVEKDFEPGIGFVPRSNIDRNQVRLRFSPRPKRAAFKRVRKFTWGINLDNITTASTGAFESRQIEARSETEFQSGDQLNVQLTRNRETVSSPFAVAGGLTVPIGAYRFNEFEMRYQMGQQRKVAGGLGFQRGGFYGGTRTEYSYNFARVEVSSRFSVEPQIQINRLDTPFGKATTKLISGRVNLTLSPRMLVSALSQYNSTNNQLATNIRFRWEYQPGSDLFVVYGDGRDTLSKGFPALATRSFVVKFTRLFRF